jgi:hypothetical protein
MKRTKVAITNADDTSGYGFDLEKELSKHRIEALGSRP